MSCLDGVRRLLLLGLCLGLLATTAPTAQAQAQARLEVHRHAGDTRTQTAAAVAQHTHGGGAPHVVLARADAYGDALAAAPLAAALDAPMLLTDPAALDPAAREEISRLGVSSVTVLGDIADDVIDQLTEAGLEVARLRGADRWSTYAAIADEVVTLTGATHALLAEGSHADPQRGWPDALAASAWAASAGLPILLTTSAALPPATATALRELAITTVSVVGGTAAVGDAVLQRVEDTVGEVERVAGDGRYDTAVAVAARTAVAPASVWVASGRNWPDALVAGPAVARDGGVLVLSDPVSMQHSPATRAFLDIHRADIGDAHLVGGTAVLSEDVAHTVATGVLRELGEVAPEPEPGPVSTSDFGPPRPDVDRPPAVPARNTAPPVSAAVPWSDPATWGGTVPRAGDTVTIPADLAVLLDVDPPALRGIRVDGTLTFADRPITLEVDWITVDGHLAIGTEEAPLTADIRVVLHPRAGDFIAGGGEGPIAVHGGTLDIHGRTPTRPWTRLADTAVASTSALTLQDTPGWRAGDQIVIASTSTDPDEAEERTVTAVTGTTVTLDRPLTHTHWGRTEVLGDTPVRQHAEVGNLTRNVVITSADAAIANQRGGHVMVFHGSLARISGAEFTGLGQVGEVARYPVHFHMMGNASGSYVRGASVHHTFNRCVTFHGSDHVDMVETVGYESIGHCYFFEDGVEVGNTLHCNLGLSTRRPAEGLAILESDLTPATFWITNPSNHLTGNVAAGSDSHGFWFDLPEAPTGMSAGVEMDIRRQPFGHFDHNVAHSSGDNGWKDGIGIWVEEYHPPTPAVMRHNTVYKVGAVGAWIEGAELHHAVLADNGIGFLGVRARLVDATMVGATSNAGGDSPWRQTGVGLYHDPSEIVRPTFVSFGPRQHAWQRRGTAIEMIAESLVQTSVVSGARFISADRLRVTQPDHPERGADRRTAALRDVDGSISGAPALLTSAAPLMHDPSCRWLPEFGAMACPVDYDRTWLIVKDLNGADLGPTSLTRPDGVSGPFDGPSWNRGQKSSDVLLNQTYRVTSEAAHSGHIEVIMSGEAEGYVDLQIPWPHAEAHVYDGWGRWHPMAAGQGLGALADGGFWFDGSTLHVRHALDDVAERGSWQRLELCATAHCGNSGPG